MHAVLGIALAPTQPVSARSVELDLFLLIPWPTAKDTASISGCPSDHGFRSRGGGCPFLPHAANVVSEIIGPLPYVRTFIVIVSSRMSIRSATSLLVLSLGLTVLLAACQTTEPQRIINIDDTEARYSITGTVIDSLTKEPLDSVRVSYRGTDRTLYTDARGRFTLSDVPPGMYIFDLSKYGYHSKGNVSAVVAPAAGNVQIETSMLNQSLDMQCRDIQADYHADLETFLSEDSSAVRLRTLDFVAEGRDVLVQPVISNNVNAPIFLPENLGAYGHFDLSLVTQDGTPVSYEFPQALPREEGMGTKQVYERGDVRVIVPRESQRLDATRVRITESVSPGTALFAKVRYNFSLDQTLRPTPTSTFEDLNLDSLRKPVYDTLRVSDRLIVPDSLVIGVDTTRMRVEGNDTTITRDGEILYSSAENDTLDVRTALRLLRLKKEPQPLGPVQLPPVDTTRPPLYVVNRLDADQRNRLITEPERLTNLIDSSWPDDSTATRALRTRQRPLWRYDLPQPTEATKLRLDSVLTRVLLPDSIRIDSLLSDSVLLAPLLPSPSASSPGEETGTASRSEMETNDAPSETAINMNSPAGVASPSDSLTGDQPASSLTDSTLTDEDASQRGSADPDTTESVKIDSAVVDTVITDSSATVRTNPVKRGASTTGRSRPGTTAVASSSPGLTLDSLRQTVNVDSLRQLRRAELLRETLKQDSTRGIALEVLRSAVLVDSLERSYRGDSVRVGPPPQDELIALATTLDSLQSNRAIPREKMAVQVPQSWSVDSSRVLLISPMLLRQRVTPLVDSSLVADLTEQTPPELALRQRRLDQTIVQQLILVPTALYRDEYLQAWTELQRKRLTDPYCDIFRQTLESDWRSTTLQ